MRININLKNDFKHICLSAISCVDMNMFVYMRLPCSSKNAEKGLCYADEQIFSKLKCSLYLTECGEPYSILLAPLALIYKRGPTLRSTIS
jgi:hypothetical protein